MGVLALPVVAPAAVVNVVVVGMLRCLDLVAKVVSVVTPEPLARLYQRLRPYPEVPTDGVTGPGDGPVGAVLDEPWPALVPAFRRL